MPHYIFVLVLLSGCIADLRKDSPPNPSSDSKARTILKRMSDAHGGTAAWQKNANVSADITDVWINPVIFWVGAPWAANPQTYRTDFPPKGATGRITFLNGSDLGTSWGYQNGRTYHVEAGNLAEEGLSEDAEFWIPTTIYFLESPFRLAEAEIVRTMSSAVIEGETYHRVFLTWQTEEPTMAADQYVAWIHQKTNRLEFLQYTVRDFGSGLTGCMAFTDFTEFGEFTIAKKMRVVTEPGGEPTLHRFEIDDIRFNLPHPSNYFQPLKEK